MKRLQRSALGIVGGLAVLASGSPSNAALEDFIKTIGSTSYAYKDYTHYNARSNTSGNHDFDGRLYVPDNYDPSQSYPLVVMHHGNGEAGTDNLQQVDNGNINNLLKNAKNRGYFLYVPQSPGQFWNNEQTILTTLLVARASRDYNIDSSRLYMTGLSQGGNGVHREINLHHNLYAGFVNLSPGSASSLEEEKAVGLPIWYYHGRDDTVVSVNTSRGAIRAILQAQNVTPPTFPALDSPDNFFYAHGDLKYTEYANGGHNNTVWSNGAYNDNAMYDWLLAKRKTFGALTDGKTVAVNFAGSAMALTTDADNQRWNTAGRVGMDNTLDFIVGFGQDTAGDRTTTSIEVTKAFDGISSSNVTPGVTAIDPAIAGKYWQTKLNQSGEFTIRGLEPNAEYALEIFASINASGYTGIYSANEELVTLDASFNTDELALLDGLFADDDGLLQFSVTPAPGSSRAVINAFTITSIVPEPAFLSMAALGALLARRRRRQGATSP